jgi:hypothetical protein
LLTRKLDHVRSLRVLAVIVLAAIGAITLLSDNVRSAIESVANILP